MWHYRRGVAALYARALITGKPYLVPYGAATDLGWDGHADRPSHRAGACCRSWPLRPRRWRRTTAFRSMPSMHDRFHSGRAERQMERRAGRVRSPADDAGCDPGGGRGLQELHRADVAGGGAARHFARELRPVHRRPRARRQDHGLRRRAAGVHQGVLGLSSICSSPTSASRKGRELLAPARRSVRRRSSAPTASIAMSSRRSGASRRNTARSRATAR